MKNPHGRRVTPENAHEVWQSYDGRWTYWVLKKYQTPEKEEKNPYACWYCWVKSPFTSERGEYGDVYISSVTNGARKIDNPLSQTRTDNQTTGKENTA